MAEPVAYSNRTLVGNWWEDRYVPSQTQLTTTERVFARDLTQPCTSHENSSEQDPYKTVKQFSDETMIKSRSTSIRQLNKPSLYPDQTAMKSRLETYMPGGRPPAELTYTIGRIPSTQLSKSEDRFLTTTNQHFYKELPAQALATGSSEVRPDTDRRFHKTASIAWEVAANAHLSDPASECAGSKGGRGELTRNPKEAGNPYGVSVFVDDYAQWGRKLAGKMTHGETVNRKMTSYF